MQLSAIQPATRSLAAAPAATHAVSAFRPRASVETALLDLHGVGFFQLFDTLTGYGRAEGYDSLANARRAAYALSVGAASPAAGVFQSGSRYFVRSLGAVTAKGPHVAPGVGTTDAAAAGAALALLHFEGNDTAHFAWVRDSRLVVLVDGKTKIWSRDAHHQPPA